MSVCRVDGCENPIHIKSRQLCNMHYIRLRVHGDVLGGGEQRGQPYEWIMQHLHTDSDECLPWPFSLNDHGYGRIRHEGREWVASRLMCTLKHGEAPSDRHQAAHSCGNGHNGCTNPNHLRWDTPEGNQADRVEHGTSNRGEKNGHAKLDVESVHVALRLRDEGMLQKQIADELGVSVMTISDLFNGHRWSWLTGIQPKHRPPRKRKAANDNSNKEMVA